MVFRKLTRGLQPQERLILAYDRPAFGLVDEGQLLPLNRRARCIKIGYETHFAAQGFSSVAQSVTEYAHEQGLRIMADFKVRGTEDTLAAALPQLIGMFSPQFVTIDATMAYKNILTCFRVLKSSGAIVVGVGVPSDHSAKDIKQVYGDTPEGVIWKCAQKLAKAVKETGGRGAILAPPPDLAMLHKRETNPQKSVPLQALLRIAVGVRHDDSTRDNHSRWGTPAQAIKAGADYLVIGRPILGADDPIAAADQIADEISTAL